MIRRIYLATSIISLIGVRKSAWVMIDLLGTESDYNIVAK